MSNVNFYLEIEGVEQSILKISEDVIASLRLLLKYEDAFGIAYFLHKKDNVGIDVSDENSVKILANNILMYSLPDIRKFDGGALPDLNYSRSYGFTFGLLFKKDEKKILSLTFKLGGISKNTIGTLSMDKNYSNDFEWYKSILHSFVLIHKVVYAAVRPDDLIYLENGLRCYQYIFGWITYFSNDLEIQIPNDLGVEYEYSDKGKYLFLTRDDFTADKETYKVRNEQLLSIMEEIKRRIPEYAK